MELKIKARQFSSLDKLLQQMISYSLIKYVMALPTGTVRVNATTQICLGKSKQIYISIPSINNNVGPIKIPYTRIP